MLVSVMRLYHTEQSRQACEWVAGDQSSSSMQVRALSFVVVAIVVMVVERI